jgi:hypothetical protein
VSADDRLSTLAEAREPNPWITESNDRYTGLLCGW